MFSSLTFLTSKVIEINLFVFIIMLSIFLLNLLSQNTHTHMSVKAKSHGFRKIERCKQLVRFEVVWFSSPLPNDTRLC